MSLRAMDFIAEDDAVITHPFDANHGDFCGSPSPCSLLFEADVLDILVLVAGLVIGILIFVRFILAPLCHRAGQSGVC